ncbi:hypothetical protein B5X24_HaOG216488 [Helicoverpa armigera]|nr:hypothetical protein B5X24_HaOG216488 [Helicoverpa armigera]
MCNTCIKGYCVKAYVSLSCSLLRRTDINMKIILVLTLLLIGIFMVESRASVRCTTEFYPVCGTNGKSYSNRCLLSAAGVKMAHAGECKQLRILDSLM